MFFKNQRNFEF